MSENFVLGVLPTARCRAVNDGASEHQLRGVELLAREVDLLTAWECVPPVVVHALPADVDLAAYEIPAQVIVHDEGGGGALPARWVAW
ncbi:hypothetical protein Q7X28_18440 [Tsukamurella strandjordii]|uniref:Uncharacterized protein n=1 Tax=Tsukamurella strandjordii TaxID=147577 RepID=A0AA90NLK1_9ACTN|nr:hypothetical protein [Tsukamurella strandjordii]MDP0399899.1 hypothetical protein [Tsukamurella strandjordii]